MGCVPVECSSSYYSNVERLGYYLMHPGNDLHCRQSCVRTFFTYAPLIVSPVDLLFENALSDVYQKDVELKTHLHSSTRFFFAAVPRLEVHVDPLVKRIKAGGTGTISCSSTGGFGKRTVSWTPVVRA